MLGPSHRIAGAAAWLAVAPLLHETKIIDLVVGMVIASVFAHGALSPDIDQKLGWHHRGITHFWIWPLIVFQCGRLLHNPVMLGDYAINGAVLPYAVAVAWASHIVADGIFGRVPILPRIGRRRSRHTSSWRSSHWQYAGLGFATGGFTEKYIVTPVLAGACVILLVTSVLLTSSGPVVH